MLRNTRWGWGWLARHLHWLMALLILGQVVLGKYAHELERSPQKLSVMMWHKSIGITLLGLALIRLAWAVFNNRPEAPPGMPPWQQRAARLSHAALYGLMLAIPVSGWLYNSASGVPFSLYRVVPWPSLVASNEGWADLFEEWHEGLVTALLVLLALHAGAALWHHFVRRDNVLTRMLTGLKFR